MKLVPPRVTYRDLCEQPEDGRRYEIYDGEVFVVPSPLPIHQVVALNFYTWLRHHPRTRGGLTLAAPLDIVLSEFDVLQPDIVYFEPDRLQQLSARAAIRFPPDLAVEVLSPATERTDRGRKMQSLARFGVREYWLVDPDSQAVEIYTLTGTGFRMSHRASGEGAIVSPLLGRLEDATASLFQNPLR